MRKTVFFFFVFALLVSAPIFSTLAVNSSVNKTCVNLGETFTYTLQFDGLSTPIPQPSLPQLEGAVVKGQYQSVAPLKNGTSYLYHYIISPTKGGRIFLDEFTVKIENRTLKAKGFSVEVKGDAPPAAIREKANPAPLKEEIFLEGRLSKKELFEGEAVIYSLHLLTRESIRNFEFVRKSEFDGFRKIELPQSLYPPTTKVTRNSRIFLDATILKCILFPLKTGIIPISPFLADVKVQGGPGFSNPLARLEGGRAEIRVSPLPPPPEDFTGAIGVFTAEYVAKKAGEGKVGEPLTIDIHIKGVGALPNEPFLIEKTPFFTSYPPKIEDRSKEKDGKLNVDRTLHFSFVPLVAGTRSPPGINFVYFDPSDKKFNRIELKSIQLFVRESHKTGESAKPEILSIIPVPESFQPAKVITINQGIRALIIPFLFSLAVLLVASIFEKLFLSPEKKRVRSLTVKALKEFKTAKANLDARKSKVFHAHLRKALEAVLEIKTGEPVSSLTQTEIKEKLKERNLLPREAEIVTSFLEEIDSAAFSMEKPQKTELKKRLDKMRRLIKKREAPSLSLMVFALFFLSLFVNGQNSILISKAGEEYGRGRFAEALKYYKMAEEAGSFSPELYYNIGNAFFETGELPEAILYYKKSLKLEPGLYPAKSNLQLARNLLPAKASPYEPSPFESFLLTKNPASIFYVALALVLLANIIFSLPRLFNFYFAGTFLLRSSFLFLFFGLIASSVFLYSFKIRSDFKDAVVLKKTNVFEKPDPSMKPTASLPAGSEIYLIQSSGAWARIRWGEGEGWTISDNLGMP